MLIIERFEGTKVIIENEEGNFITEEKSILPEGAKEGDCLIFENGVYSIDRIMTNKKRKENIDLQNSLWE